MSTSTKKTRKVNIVAKKNSQAWLLAVEEANKLDPVVTKIELIEKQEGFKVIKDDQLVVFCLHFRKKKLICSPN